MENYQASKQEIITLLSRLEQIRTDYPPDLLAARRRLYLGMVAQVAATHIITGSYWKRWISAIEREPGSIVTKALIIIFIALLIAFVAHAFATGNLYFGRILDLIVR
jgi:hypothetical protein